MRRVVTLGGAFVGAGVELTEDEIGDLIEETHADSLKRTLRQIDGDFSDPACGES